MSSATALPDEVDIRQGCEAFIEASKRLELSFQAEQDGISEIMIPSREYGGEATVTGSGFCYAIEGDRILIEARGSEELDVTVEP